MNIQKDIALRAAYDKGRHARMYGSEYKKGRTQGHADAKREVKDHLSGKRHLKWLEELLHVSGDKNDKVN